MNDQPHLFKKLYPANQQKLAALISDSEYAEKSFFLSMSETSTVIPYHQLEHAWTEIAGQRGVTQEPLLVNLSRFPKKIELINDESLSLPFVRVEGPVSWIELQQELAANGFAFPVMPTEVTASVLAGIATSCTGEHSFGYGPLRNWVQSIEWMDVNGNVHTSQASDPLVLNSSPNGENLLASYQCCWDPYRTFKNGPLPRMERAVDLLIGTEGQLGIILAATFSIIKRTDTEHFAISCPHWVLDDCRHFSLVEWVQSRREMIIACELIDEKANNLLDPAVRIFPAGDTIFLEVKASASEEIAQSLMEDFPELKEDELVGLPSAKVHQFRLAVPRLLNERNSRLGLLKKGTDVQVEPQHLGDLLAYYRRFAQVGIEYTLFGHIGDAHLHYNFLPTAAQQAPCDQLLTDFYQDLAQATFAVSPFAEHGIGLLKQKFIKAFIQQPEILNCWSALKQQWDPNYRLFGIGYLSLAKDKKH